MSPRKERQGPDMSSGKRGVTGGSAGGGIRVKIMGIWSKLKQAKSGARGDIPTLDATTEPTEIFASDSWTMARAGNAPKLTATNKRPWRMPKLIIRTAAATKIASHERATGEPS